MFPLGGNEKGYTLVLRKFDLIDNGESNNVIKIVGRPKGFAGWLFSIIGLDSESSIDISTSRIEFTNASLFGQLHKIIPLQAVATTGCGFSKPIGLLITGIIFIILGIAGGFIGSSGITIGIIIGAVFLIAYGLNKKLFISIESNGGSKIGLSFKRSLIENVSVDINRTKRTIEVLNDLVCKAQAK